MNILFLTAHPYLPQMYGGLQTSTNELCLKLTQNGHRVAVLSALLPKGLLGVLSRIKIKLNWKFYGLPATQDNILGYTVWRAWFPWLAVAKVIAKTKPDVIVILAVKPVKMALAAKPSGIPLIIQLQDVEFSQHGGDFAELGNVFAIANSDFTARTYKESFGISPIVIHPFIQKEKYRTETSRENVTFINPHAYKGLTIALALARLCPDIPFTFVEAWPLKADELYQLKLNLAQLPNVTLLKPQTDMRKIYGKCKILLVPSLWNEGYGRVAHEAQISGIPVIASTRGGLPEAVGPGGLLLDPESPIENWVNALRSLWQNDDAYAKMSAVAKAYAERPEASFESHMNAWVTALQSAVNQQSSEHIKI